MDLYGSSSPSLRLKIKLGPNMKAEPASPRVPQTHQEEEGKLKIIIKKRSDSQGNTTPSNSNITNEKVNLSLIPFPVTSNCPFFQKACSYSSFEQLEKWSEKELNSLAEELETMRKSFKDFNTTLQNQLDALETWRARSQIPRKNGESVPPSPSTAPPKFESITSPIPVQNISTPTTPVAHGASSSKANSKNVHKKRKVHQNDSSDGDDKDPSFVKKESDSEPSSEDEDEIDVVDIDDSVASEDNKDKVRSKSTEYNFGKKDQKNKMNVSTRNKRNSVGRRNKQNKGSRQSTRERKKSRKGEEMDSDADDPLGKWPNGNFWRDVEAYFTPFTTEDLRFCTPVQISSDDPIFKIPPLGKPEEFDAGEDEETYEPVRSLRMSTQREPPPPPPPVERVVENQDQPDKLPSCGDLTARILSALIEEKIVPITMDISTPQDVEMNGDTNGVEISSPFKTPSDEFLPLETPPTYDYSQQSMMNLEDRIKLELKSIGLLDDEDLNIDSSSREDDEICSEMRRLQKQLREQILNNNTMRTKVHSLLEQAITKEEQQKKERAANATLEKTYFKLMRKKKRKPTGKEVS